MILEGKLFVRDNLIESPDALDYFSRIIIPDIDANSEFDKRNSNALNQLEGKMLIEFLASQGYEAMLSFSNQTIVGHIAYQEHREESEELRTNWQMFRIKVLPEYVGKGYSYLMAEELIKRAREDNVGKVKFGSGNHPFMKILLKNMNEKRDQLGVEVNQNTYWVSIKP